MMSIGSNIGHLGHPPIGSLRSSKSGRCGQLGTIVTGRVTGWPIEQPCHKHGDATVVCLPEGSDNVGSPSRVVRANGPTCYREGRRRDACRTPAEISHGLTFCGRFE
jgi:hypothetical protein